MLARASAVPKVPWLTSEKVKTVISSLNLMLSHFVPKVTFHYHASGNWPCTTSASRTPTLKNFNIHLGTVPGNAAATDNTVTQSRK
ncbi:hypothetical protein AVEN_207097-1, partial [Araneus ventricosus]